MNNGEGESSTEGQQLTGTDRRAGGASRAVPGPPPGARGCLALGKAEAAFSSSRAHGAATGHKSAATSYSKRAAGDYARHDSYAWLGRCCGDCWYNESGWPTLGSSAQ